MDNWSEHSQQTGTSLVNVDSGLGSDARQIVVTRSLSGGSDAPGHPGSETSDVGIVADLERELQLANAAKQKLQNEMNTLREEQSTAIAETQRHIAEKYAAQVGSQQQSLLEAEGLIHSLEAQLTWERSSKEAEIEQLLQRQEDIRKELLHESDQKHASHVSRLTAEFQKQQEAFSHLVDGDAGEQEAERLRMLKEKMRDLHEGEKQQIEAQHEREKKQIQAEFESWADRTRQQMEAAANKKIQEMHTQFMLAHQALSEQKAVAETAVEGLRHSLAETESRLHSVEEEKASVESKHRSLLESRAEEMELLQLNHRSLEQVLGEWRDKAANLELRLEHSAAERVDTEQLRRRSEELQQELQAEYEQRLRLLQDEAAQSKSTLQAAIASKERDLETLRSQHQHDLERLTSNHLGKLEESMGDVSVSQASLEVAEEHMSGLQRQLEAYRTQEQNFTGQLSELREAHARDIEALKQQHEQDIADVTAGFESQVESQETELKELQCLVESNHAQSADGKLIEAMTAEHQSAMQEMRCSLEESKQELLQAHQEALEGAHARQLDDFRGSHGNELQAVRTELEREWSARFKAVQEEVKTEQETLRDEELEQLKMQHQQELRRGREALSQAEERGSRAEAHSLGLDAQVAALQKQHLQLEEARRDVLSQLELAQRQLQETEARANADKARLSEQYRSLTDEVKSLGVDLDIARSAVEQEKVNLGAAKEESGRWMGVAEDLQARVSKLVSAREAESHDDDAVRVLALTDQLAERNRDVTDLRSQNDDLNAEVFSLTQQFQSKALEAASLREEVGGGDDQVRLLREQLAAALAKLQETASHHDKLVHERGSEIAALRSRLEMSNNQLSEQESHWSSKYEKALAASSQEVDTLRQEVESSCLRENEQKGLLDELEEEVRELDARNKDVVQGRAELEVTVGQLHDQVTALSKETDSLRHQNSNLQALLDNSKEREFQETVQRLHVELETAQSAQASLGGELSEVKARLQAALEDHARAISEKERASDVHIQSLQLQLAEKESALAEAQRDFDRRLAEAQSHESALLQSLEHSHVTEEQLGAAIGEKSALEEALVKARQSLSEKLHEKAALDRDLGTHKVELERRLGEKKRLEDLLFEKARFEQELCRQKEDLRQELEEIESRLQSRDQQLTSLRVAHKQELGELERGLQSEHGEAVGRLKAVHTNEVN